MIGDKRHRLAVQSFTAAKNSSGEEVKTWSTLTTVWGNVITKSGQEAYESDKLTALNEVTFVIRYTSVTSAVTEKMRISWNSWSFGIKHIGFDNKLRYLTIRAERIY